MLITAGLEFPKHYFQIIFLAIPIKTWSFNFLEMLKMLQGYLRHWKNWQDNTVRRWLHLFIVFFFYVIKLQISRSVNNIAWAQKETVNRIWKRWGFMLVYRILLPLNASLINVWCCGLYGHMQKNSTIYSTFRIHERERNNASELAFEGATIKTGRSMLSLEIQK